MKKRSCGLMVVLGAMFALGANMACADEGVSQLVQDADQSIAAAESAVEEARVAIERSKQLIALIPSDSPFMAEVKEMLMASSKYWSASVASLDGAKQSASMISQASNPEVAKDYKLLSTVNSRVAFSGAKVVQIGLFFIDSVANNRSESLDLIRVAMQDALVATSQVQFNYDRVKELISKKYSK